MPFCMFTFDCVCDILAANMISDKPAIVMLYFPFIVNNVTQFDFRASVVMTARTTNDNSIFNICLIRSLLAVALENTKAKLCGIVEI